jgi:hypothetical protein
LTNPLALGFLAARVRSTASAVEMQQLIEAQAEDGDDLRIELPDAPFRELLDEVIQAALPSQRTRDNLRGERSIALVLEPFTT